MTFDEGFATLLAAIIAALFSLFNLLATKPKELRDANRKALEPYIYDLSDSIHQLIAISNILLKNKTQESRDNWKAKAEIHKNKLKDIRPKIRYPLWKLDKYLQSLSRFTDYTAYTLEDKLKAERLVKSGSRFGNKVDQCVRMTYLTGEQPNFYHLWMLEFYNWHFKKIRNEYKAEKDATDNKKTAANSGLAQWLVPAFLSRKI